jgi:hypothetical protein
MNSSAKKLSTDEKLRSFLNKSENLDEDNAILEQEYKQARDRIRTSSLYGAGAKYRAPKTKVLQYARFISCDKYSFNILHNLFTQYIRKN